MTAPHSTPNVVDPGFEVVDFRPAPPGWRIVLLEPDQPGVPVYTPLPGWLVIRRLGQVEVVAAVTSGHTLTPVFSIPDAEDRVWMVLSPDEPKPSREEAAAEWDRRWGDAAETEGTA